MPAKIHAATAADAASSVIRSGPAGNAERGWPDGSAGCGAAAAAGELVVALVIEPEAGRHSAVSQSPCSLEGGLPRHRSQNPSCAILLPHGIGSADPRRTVRRWPLPRKTRGA